MNIIKLSIVKYRIPKVCMYAYEPDFNLLMKFFQENLGEAPTIVKSEQLPDPLSDKTVLYIFYKVF